MSTTRKISHIKGRRGMEEDLSREEKKIKCLFVEAKAIRSFRFFF